ncbi:hypothetical protein BGZ92_010998 [Podila epicladia]|nr:hypothetical protein BGZ92_010998 [Podila epicladia]
MSKRGGEDQITKDNYDDDANDGSNETMGTFKKASNDEISKRIGGGDAPKAPSAFASFGTPSTTQSGFGEPAVNFSSTVFSATSTTSFTGFGDKSKPTAFSFSEKPATSAFTGFGDKPAPAFTSFGDKPAATGFGDKPAPAFTSFGDKPAATGFGDKPAPSFTSFGDKPAATGFGDKPAPTFPTSTGFSFKSSAPSILDQAKPSPSTNFGDKPALSSTPNPFGDKTSTPSFTGFDAKPSTISAFTGFAKGADSGSSPFKAFPDTRSTTTAAAIATTTTLNGKDNAPKPFNFTPTTAPSTVLSTSNKPALRTELCALNRNFIDKLQSAVIKEGAVNLAQVFNKYTESRLKLKKQHSGSGAKDAIQLKSTSPAPFIPSSLPFGFGGSGQKSEGPIELFTGRTLDTDKPKGIFTGRKLSDDDSNEDDEDVYNGNAEDWEEQQEFEGHHNGGIEDEYEEVDENDENDYNQDEDEERNNDEAEAEEGDAEEPKPKPFGGFSFGVADAAKPKPATFNFGVTPSSTNASSTATTTSTAPASGMFGGAFSSASFGASTGGAFGNLTSKGSDSASKTSTPAWNFGQVSTSAPASTPSMFSTSANPFSSAASSITPAPFAPPKPFSFAVPGASTTASTTTSAPFAGFQVPKAPAASNMDAESDKMPDDTKSELVDDRVGEEDEKTVFEVKAKLYAVEGGENKDKGVGQFRVNENGETKKRRMIMRIAGTGQLVLNSWVIQKMPPKREKNIVTLFAIEEGKPKRFMLRVKEESSAIELVKELELGQLDK